MHACMHDGDCLIREGLFLQVMDYGFPQFTEAKILSEYIKTDAYKMEVSLSSNLPALPLSGHADSTHKILAGTQ